MVDVAKRNTDVGNGAGVGSGADVGNGANVGLGVGVGVIVGVGVAVGMSVGVGVAVGMAVGVAVGSDVGNGVAVGGGVGAGVKVAGGGVGSEIVGASVGITKMDVKSPLTCSAPRNDPMATIIKTGITHLTCARLHLLFRTVVHIPILTLFWTLANPARRRS